MPYTFEGRSDRGWNRHVLLTALAYTWLQHEHRRAGARYSDSSDHARGNYRGAHRPFVSHASALPGNHDEIQGFPSADLTKSY